MRTLIYVTAMVFMIVSCTLKQDDQTDDQLLRTLVSDYATSSASSAREAAGSGKNFRVGGNITGLGGIIFLQNNAAEQAPFNISGRFYLPKSYPDGTNYVITVSTQPPGQTCTISNGFGKVSGGDVTNIIVNCITN
ncbi:hypothetical protein NUH30_18560 [Leptospira sp. 85282-16]|uniref:Hemagglutinin n=1 Tax=Leptospira montravelensis TaxID=2484961 RepID=A0ABY2LMI1_9LEPT|nr:MULTISPECIES: hypothetical protein [Leptospira]MCT8335694.1 hypothetical protein [Leptospira sp. 85282-16]TGK86137.1 hypothetical protein EHQ19_01460 [Leptospira montravelensis]TGK95014.1 hypothetical protein EHQ31_18370 [Leptospira montravelensis]